MVRNPKAADAKPVEANPVKAKPANVKPADAAAPTDTRGKIIAALMALASGQDFTDITIREIVEQAGVSLADFREAFPSKGAVLAGFARQTDLAVLRDTGEEMAEETAKDRLFDVLMRRLDVMAPHKPAIKNILHWARRDPLAAAALNGVALNSMRFMLEAAKLSSEGPAGGLKLQGLVFAWSRVLGVWLHDEDAGLAKTMAALDKELERGATLSARADDFARLTAPLRSLCEGLMGARRGLGERMRKRERWSRGENAGEPNAPAY